MASTGNSELYEKGKEMRIKVLGEAYVAKKLSSRQSEFTKPLQLFSTEMAWGSVWSRPGLALRDRSLANISFLIALKSWTELGTHTKGAIRNGLTEIEIRELVLQSMAYCGIPAGTEAMKVTEAAINELVEAGDHVRQLKEKV